MDKKAKKNYINTERQNMRLNQKQMALSLNISTRTLRRYIKSGRIIPEGYDKNHPYYSEKQIIQYILKYGKTKKTKVVWMVKHPLNRVKIKKVETINQIVLSNKIEDFFEEDNPNLNLILDLLIAYKIDQLLIDAAVYQRYTGEIRLLKLICQKYDVKITKEYFKNEE